MTLSNKLKHQGIQMCFYPVTELYIRRTDHIREKLCYYSQMIVFIRRETSPDSTGEVLEVNLSQKLT